MKVAVFSDSHGKTDRMKVVTDKLTTFEVFVHLGDHTRDVGFIDTSSFGRTFSIRGNCDFTGGSPSALFDVGGVTIFAVHGHRHDVKYNYQKLFYAAKERAAHVCLFGHTHIPEVFAEEGILFVNPGSISLPRGGLPSYAVLDIQHGIVDASIIADYGHNTFRITQSAASEKKT